MALNIFGTLVTLLIFTPFVLIVVWAFRYQKRIYQRSWDMIEELLKRNQVRITSPIPEDRRVMLKMDAEWKGKRLEIWNQYEGAGKSRTLFTYMKLHVNSKTLPAFSLYKENFLTKTGEKLGIKDIKTGDTEFDKFYRLNSDFDVADTQHFFDLNLVNKLVEEKKIFYGDLSSAQGVLTVKIHSVPGHKVMWPYFEGMFRIMLYIAEKAK